LLDRSDADVDAFVAQYSSLLNFPVLQDDAREASRAYDIAGTPTTVVINPDNKVVLVHVGTLDDHSKEEVLKLLGAK